MTLTNEHFPVGQQMDVTYSEFKVILSLHSITETTFGIKEGVRPYGNRRHRDGAAR